VARYDLRLSDEDFYALTPRQFDALLKRKRVETVNQEFLAAQLTSWVANTGFRAADKPTKAQDFMPSEWARTTRSSTHSDKRTRMTKKRRAEIADSIRSMFPNLRKRP
jgi:hypothetical protein